tara:strand:+ start:844 stop:1227 length:384 start_codon:yes stop_codon:yes gene_type:complete
MVEKKLIIEIKELKAVIAMGNLLYDFLIIYSNEYIPPPTDKILKTDFSNIAFKYNINQMKKYIIEMELINNILLNNFNKLDDPPIYTKEKDELDNLLELCYHKDINISNINLSDISDNSDLELIYKF